MRVDTTGAIWETVFDVVSLGVSAVEVCMNPDDPWAWAGLAGDAIDLIPFVTGVGEITRGIKVSRKVVDTLDGAADATRTLSKGGSKADILAQNRAVGRAFEQQEFAKFSSKYSNAVEQITIKTPSGVRTRVDAIGLDVNGNVVINEFKSSLSAPLTYNQYAAFPEIFSSGGIVVGKGKGIFTGGYIIPAGTDIKIIRP